MTPSHHAVVALFVLVLGACVGSFLNVCVYRIPIGLSVLRPRSRCPGCLTAIRFRDNLPALGWLLLRGKCRHCRSLISPRYPMIELTVGLMFAGSYLTKVALAPGGPWEDTGPLGVLLYIVLSWGLIGVFVVGPLMAHDTRRASRRLALGRGIGREQEVQARSELVVLREPVPVQLDDFAGATSVTEPIARNAPGRIMIDSHPPRRMLP
jgi:hypothetical protein